MVLVTKKRDLGCAFASTLLTLPLTSLKYS